MKNLFRRNLVLAVTVILSTLTFTTMSMAQAQDQPAKPKAKKVWTNDDFARPSQAVSQSAPQAAPVKAAPQKPKDKPILPEKIGAQPAPTTFEEADLQLRETRVEVQQQTTMLGKIRTDLLGSTIPEQRQALQHTMDVINGRLQVVTKEVEQLEIVARELKKQQDAAPQEKSSDKSAAPAPAQPPSK